MVYKTDMYFVDVGDTSYSIIPNGSLDVTNEDPEYVLYENTLMGRCPLAVGDRFYCEDKLNKILIKKAEMGEDPNKDLHEAIKYLSRENFRKNMG